MDLTNTLSNARFSNLQNVRYTKCNSDLCRFICSREGKDGKFRVRLLTFSTASFTFSSRGTSWSRVQSDPHANRELTSASEYPGPPGSAPPIVFANSLSIFIVGPGALQLDVIGYLSFDQPCRSVLGPAGRSTTGPRRLCPACVPGAENCFPPRRGPWKRANFALKFSSRDALWKSKPRRLRVYRVSRHYSLYYRARNFL